ncbi:DUF1700 domain-containing protein [Lactococcus petauri]|uniref:DUF1700 domain-containing protein n=1 Tax=Lactococcus petauri TaxID=1940789 RepID=UPI000E409B51|nr:DUF1700 domain-containing protein [Lactococcus petauri]RGB59487.1 DUF1700 domain-containing protein [Lactococcus petauri]
MNSYLEAVQAHLTDLPQEESRDLIAYYQEYFIESGMTLEDITAQYGTPKQFATKLKLSYFLDQDDHAQEEEKSIPAKSRFQLVWLIILGLFASPLLVPLALAILLLILALLMMLLALLFSLYMLDVSLVFGGLFSFITGLGVIFSSPMTTLVFSGLGLLLFGLGILISPFILFLTKWLCLRFLGMIKWLGRKLTQRTKRDQKGGVL